jgi:hypothetical protein
MRRTVQILPIRNIQFFYLALLSSAILIRNYLKTFEKIFVGSITLEFHPWSVRYRLIVILLIVWSYCMAFKLILITRGTIKWYFRNLMLWIRTFLKLYWSRSLKLLFISRMILEFRRRLKTIIRNFLSPIDKSILLRVIIRL